MLQRTAIVLLFSALAASARADVTTGPYVGVGVGASRFSFESIDSARTSSERSHAAEKIYAGYRFTENWGAEIGYANLGRVNNTYAAGNFKGRADAFYVAGTGRLPFNDRFALTAKAMLTFGRTRADAGISSSAAEFERLRGGSRSLVLGGLGAEYAFTPNMAGAIELDSFGAVSNKNDAAMLSANLKYHF